MNTKNNQLSRNTNEKIVRAVYRQINEMHKPIARITVREICEEAQINRSTFYAHFQDVFDVVEKVEKTMSESLTASLLETIDQTGSLNQLYEQVFRFVGKYREFYTIYFNEMHRSRVIGIAWEMLNDRFSSDFYRKVGLDPKEVSYAGAFFIHGLTGMLRIWLENGCKESPEEMVCILVHQFIDLPKNFSNVL